MTKWQWGKGDYYVHYLDCSDDLCLYTYIKTHQNVHFILDPYINYTSINLNQNVKQIRKQIQDSTYPCIAPPQLPTGNFNNSESLWKNDFTRSFNKYLWIPAMCQSPLQLLEIKWKQGTQGLQTHEDYILLQKEDKIK